LSPARVPGVNTYVWYSICSTYNKVPLNRVTISALSLLSAAIVPLWPTLAESLLPVPYRLPVFFLDSLLCPTSYIMVTPLVSHHDPFLKGNLSQCPHPLYTVQTAEAPNGSGSKGFLGIVMAAAPYLLCAGILAPNCCTVPLLHSRYSQIHEALQCSQKYYFWICQPHCGVFTPSFYHYPIALSCD